MVIEKKEDAEQLGQLFKKRSYSKDLKEADEKEFVDYKPLIEKHEEVSVPLPKDQAGREEDVKARQQNIEAAYNELEQHKIDNYQTYFNAAVEKDVVVIGEVGADELDKEKRRIEEERIKNAKHEAEVFEKQRIEMMRLQEESKTELFHRSQQLARELEKDEMEMILRARQRREMLNKAFLKSEANLNNSLKSYGGVLETKYKELSFDPKNRNINMAGDSKARDFKVRWRNAPQLLHVRVELCRCLRDKIGEGRCAILCSVFDRISGNVLDYQDKQRSRRWKRITAPKNHAGKYADDALRFEENLLLVAPSKFIATPSMIILFELFLLKSKTFSHDQVFGWGVFPLLSSELEYNRGRFRIPLLFGPVDYSIMKYGDIEKSIRNNLDTWLCNLYFSIEPREPLANPYTTQLDLDNNAHNKIVQVLDIDQEKEGESPPQVNKYMPLENQGSVSQSHSPSPSPDSLMINAKQDQNPNLRIAELLKEDDEDDEFGNPIGRKKDYKPLEKPEDFDLYTYHIPRHEFKSRVSFTNQIGYIMDEILADLGFRNVMSLEFWISVVILLLAMWFRAYLHTFGSWIFLVVAKIPITSFSPLL